MLTPSRFRSRSVTLFASVTYTLPAVAVTARFVAEVRMVEALVPTLPAASSSTSPPDTRLLGPVARRVMSPLLARITVNVLPALPTLPSIATPLAVNVTFAVENCATLPATVMLPVAVASTDTL